MLLWFGGDANLCRYGRLIDDKRNALGFYR